MQTAYNSMYKYNTAEQNKNFQKIKKNDEKRISSQRKARDYKYSDDQYRTQWLTVGTAHHLVDFSDAKKSLDYSLFISS